MRKAFLRITVTLFVALALSLPLSGVLPLGGTSTAHAAAATPPCWGATCFGKDPYALGCANNITEVKALDQSNGVTYATVWNDYSITCNANWTQGQATASATGGIYIYIQDSNGHRQCYPGTSCPDFGSQFYTGGAIAWTNMVDGTGPAWANIDAKVGTADIVAGVSQ